MCVRACMCACMCVRACSMCLLVSDMYVHIILYYVNMYVWFGNSLTSENISWKMGCYCLLIPAAISPKCLLEFQNNFLIIPQIIDFLIQPRLQNVYAILSNPLNCEKCRPLYSCKGWSLIQLLYFNFQLAFISFSTAFSKTHTQGSQVVPITLTGMHER